MPRGNDQQAALAELQSEYGGNAGHAEALIRATKDQFTADLLAAQMAATDPEATAEVEADLATLHKVAGLDSEDKIRSARVTGDEEKNKRIIFVAVSPDLRSFKRCIHLSEFREAKAPKAKPKDSPKATPKSD